MVDDPPRVLLRARRCRRPVHQGISRDSRHKRSASGARRAHYRKKRKFELGRQPAMTKLGAKRIHEVRVRGGNTKHRAMRLDTGNFAWGSEATTRKTRIIDVVSARAGEAERGCGGVRESSARAPAKQGERGHAST